MTRKRGRNLSDEEQQLWGHVTQKVKPLPEEKKQIVRHIPKTKSSPRPTLQKKPRFSPLPEEPAHFPSPSSNDHRIQRVRKVVIEATIDLHGYTRDQARQALARFLISSYEKHRLWVLVITGKGRGLLDKRASEEPRSPESRPYISLRDLVPQWLEEPYFRHMVSAYTTAKPQDGGTGALYVRLKR